MSREEKGFGGLGPPAPSGGGRERGASGEKEMYERIARAIILQRREAVAEWRIDELVPSL